MKNFLILFPIFAILVWASFALWEDYERKAPIVNGKVQDYVGYVISSENTVKKKSEQDPFWYNLSLQDPVFNKDVIKTGVDSYTALVLNDKSTITLDENSLVVIEKDRENFQVDLKIGDFTTKNTSENLIIKVKDNIIQAKQADLQISAGLDEKAQIVVSKGKALVTSKDNAKTEIDRNQILEIDEQGRVQAMQTVVLLSSPENNTRLRDPRLQVMYPFTWAVLLPEVTQEVFEVSNNADFKQSIKINAHQSVEAPVQQGLNYWRVSWTRLDPRTKTRRTFYSPTRKLYLETDDRITLQKPKDLSTYEFLPEEQKIDFSWTIKEQSDHFIFELAKNPKFTEIVKTIKTSEPNILLNDLESGGYFWRVRALNADKSLVGLSSTRSFSIKNVFPRYPELLAPASSFTWSLNEPVLFQWKPYEKADSYEVVISKDANFKVIVKQENTNQSTYAWPWTTEGKYYWQVKAFKNNTLIGESLIDSFAIHPAVKKESITLELPTNQEKILRDKKSEIIPISFEWKPGLELSPNYFLLLSEKISFEDAKRFGPLKTLRHNIRIDRPGLYFWKVEWHDENGEVKYYSPIQSFDMQFSSFLPQVEVISPAPNSSFYTATSASVKFDWQAVEGAEKYRLVIERWNPSTEQKVLFKDLNVQANSHTIDDIPPGKYFWKAKAIDANNQEGNFSPELQMQVILKESLGAPKLRPAIVK